MTAGDLACGIVGGHRPPLQFTLQWRVWKHALLETARSASAVARSQIRKALTESMSTVIANVQLMKVARFYESTIGKKAIMAVTGLILFGFLIAHMLGNLQIFLGPAIMNHYAETLHG